jgi:2-octaprenylphenol hydroxylase
MAVWDTQGTASINFSASEIQQDCLGTIVENAAIVATLYDSAMVLDNLKLMYETELESVDSTEAGYAIRLKDGQEIQSRLLVGADGGQSRVKQLAGLKSIDWSYHQTAVVTTVELDQPHDNIARQWFTASGPLALLPLNQPNYCSVVWSSTEPDQILALDAQAFCDQLTRITGKQTQAVLACDKRFSFPLTQRHAVQYTRDGLALIGDAAHTIHPLAGQGVNLGFADAQTLAQTLHQCRLEGQNPGDLKVLKRYENRRKPENMLMAAVMEGFKRLFGSDDPGVRWLRNSGLRLVNGARPLKTMAAKLAAGA